MTTHFKLAEHAQLIIFAQSPEKKWVHDNVIFRSVNDGQLRLCMSLLCDDMRNCQTRSLWLQLVKIIASSFPRLQKNFHFFFRKYVKMFRKPWDCLH